MQQHGMKRKSGQEKKGAEAKGDFSRRKIWRVGAGFMWQLRDFRKKEKKEEK